VAAVVGRGPARLEYRTPRPVDVGSLCADLEAARRMIGFSPKVDFEQGLRGVRDWFMSRNTPAAKLLESEVVENWRRSRP
jgi:nucleoside-diphosphate-sugar epimerase